MSDTVKPSTEIRDSDISVISVEGGALPADPEIRNYVALLSDGTLYVAKSAAGHNRVIDYKHLAQRMRLAKRTVDSDLDQIAQFNSGRGVRIRTEVDSGTIRLAKQLIANGAKRGASDVHIRVERNRTHIWMRIHGKLRMIEEWDRSVGETVSAALYQAMADVGDNAYKPLQSQDASIANPQYLPPGIHAIRIATTPSDQGTLMVLRLLPEDRNLGAPVGTLGYLDEQALALAEAMDLHSGEIVIAGPTGSGKSTTMQRLLRNMIAETNGSRNVITLEDPIEYPIPGAIQTYINNAETPEARKAAMELKIRSNMRLDPDVIMISEVRDESSAKTALQAALTGHLVITTLHANSAIEIVGRLTNMMLDPNLLASKNGLVCLVFQRLAPIPCPQCRLDYKTARAKGILPPEGRRMRRVIDTIAALPGSKMAFCGDGCSACGKTGAKGRVAVAEIITPDPEIHAHIREMRLIEAEKTWLSKGGRSFASVAAQRAYEGLIDGKVAAEFIGPDEAAANGPFPVAPAQSAPNSQQPIPPPTPPTSALPPSLGAAQTAAPVPQVRALAKAAGPARPPQIRPITPPTPAGHRSQPAGGRPLIAGPTPQSPGPRPTPSPLPRRPI